MKASIGVDIGGTNTCVGVVCPDGTVPLRSEFRTDSYDDGCAFAVQLADAVKTLMHAYESTAGTVQWEGLGIGAPNGNYLTGSIEEPPNLKSQARK